MRETGLFLLLDGCCGVFADKEGVIRIPRSWESGLELGSRRCLVVLLVLCYLLCDLNCIP